MIPVETVHHYMNYLIAKSQYLREQRIDNNTEEVNNRPASISPPHTSQVDAPPTTQVDVTA